MLVACLVFRHFIYHVQLREATFSCKHFSWWIAHGPRWLSRCKYFFLCSTTEETYERRNRGKKRTGPRPTTLVRNIFAEASRLFEHIGFLLGFTLKKMISSLLLLFHACVRPKEGKLTGLRLVGRFDHCTMAIHTFVCRAMLWKSTCIVTQRRGISSLYYRLRFNISFHCCANSLSPPAPDALASTTSLGSLWAEYCGELKL